MAVGVGGIGVAVLVGVAVGGCGVKVEVGNGVSVAFGVTAPQPDINRMLSSIISSTLLIFFIIDSFSNAFLSLSIL
jgi:hypothetical protein